MVYNNEAELMDAFRKGEDYAFREIYNKLSKPLQYFVESMGIDRSIAEDIMSNGFLKIYEKRAELESYDHIKRWLYVVVRNEAIDHIRYRNRERRLSHEIAGISDMETGEVDIELLKCAILSNLREAIYDLPKKRQAVIILKFFKQKDTRQIASHLNIGTQTSLNHLTRALQTLKKSMAGKEPKVG